MSVVNTGRWRIDLRRQPADLVSINDEYDRFPNINSGMAGYHVSSRTNDPASSGSCAAQLRYELKVVRGLSLYPEITIHRNNSHVYTTVKKISGVFHY